MRVSRVAVGVMCIILTASAAYAAPQPANPEDVQAVLKTLEAPYATEATRLVQSDDGYIRYLGAPPGGRFVAPSMTKTSDPATNAQDFVARHGAAFSAVDAQAQLEIVGVTATDGRQYVKLKQTYGGFEVFGSGLVVQVNADGGIVSIISDVMHGVNTEDGTLPSTAAISASVAQQMAIERVRAEVAEAKTVQLVASTPELKIFDPAVAGTDGPTRLVYYTEVSSPDTIEVHTAVFVDAITAQVPLHWTLIHTAKNRMIYDGGTLFSLGNNLLRSEGAPPTGIEDADNAYDFLGDTYDFYQTHHGRDAIDNLGGAMIAYVRVLDYGGTQLSNAFWDSTEMIFGHGWSADDVTAHELTHGVTENTSNLIYMFESGAINESFSDMWGEWIDMTNTGGLDSDELRWMIGEDVPIGAFRNMKDPTEFGDPDRYSAFLFMTFDNFGVHFNSGIGNKLCYLLTDGDEFNGQTVQGMGIARAADLMYEAQTNLLTPGSDYYDLYAALTQASLNLDFTFQERLNLRAAMAAVEIIPPGAASDLKNFRAIPAFTGDGIPVIVVNWINPESDVAVLATLVRSTQGFVSNIPDEDEQSDVNGIIVFEGETSQFIDGIDTPLTQGKEYFYSLFVDVEGGLPSLAYARAIAGDNPPDSLTEVFSDDPANPIDLSFSQLLFTPIVDAEAAQGSGRLGDYVDYTNYILTRKSNVNSLPVARNDSDGQSIALTMSDDDFIQYTLGSVAFPFFGTAYKRLYVSSNGYVAFAPISVLAAANFPTLEAHMAVPRISFLFADLAPNIGGTVWGRSLDDRLVITFDHVPEYQSFGAVMPGPNTVQLELFYSGHIRITYLALNVHEAIVGLSDGRGVFPNLDEILPGTPSSTDLSDLTDAASHFTEALDIWPPVPMQVVYEGEVLEFDVETISPAGTVPTLEATWDLEGLVPFGDNLDGTGHFRWETGYADGGMHTVTIAAYTDTEVVSQVVTLYVVDTTASPEARNLLLHSSDALEDPSVSRTVSAQTQLRAEYEYWHPEAAEDPLVFGEGESLIYWFCNGLLMPNLTNQLQVPAGITRAGDEWYYTVTPETQFFVTGPTALSPTVSVVDLPVILEVTPASGPKTGGTQVSIHGTNLDGPMNVRFGGFDAQSITAISGDEILVVTPVHAPGTVEIEVDTPEGTARLDSSFTFTDGAGSIVKADINGDGSVSAVDVQLVINGVLGAEKNYDVDANRDGVVNAADIQVVVNALLESV